MNTSGRLFLLAHLLLAVLLVRPCAADEGMWMVNLIDKTLALKMARAGMTADPSLVYDENGVSMSDAVVSLDFSCTAAVVSEYGLIMTNQHCAQADLLAVSTPGRDYVRDGFWAMTLDEEIPVPGRSALFLRFTVDVTEDVNEYMAEAAREGKTVNFRRMAYIMEEAVSRETGYEAVLSPLWGGERYCLSLYDRYEDVRLVAAPPSAVAGFGGTMDNWVWPQHKADFAIYRVYTAPDGSPSPYSADNVPMIPRNHFDISLSGCRPGDFAMVLGYPAGTERYSSSFAMKERMETVSPAVAEVRGGILDIMDKWMLSDPEIRRKYTDARFSVSNGLDYAVGEMKNAAAYALEDSLRAEDAALGRWIGSDSSRRERWGGLMQELPVKYAACADLRRSLVYYEEAFVRGTPLYRLSGRMSRTKDVSRLAEGFAAVPEFWQDHDVRVEKELLEHSVRTFFTNVDTLFWSPFHTHLYVRWGSDYAAMTDYVWESSMFTCAPRYDSLKAAVAPVLAGLDLSDTLSCEQCASALREAVSLYYDPLYQLLHSCRYQNFYSALSDIEDGVSVRMLEMERQKAMYHMLLDRGVPQYPDANSTMRLSYGKVCGMSPEDGVEYVWRTTPRGIVRKYVPGDRYYDTDPRYVAMVSGSGWQRWFPGEDCATLDFLTDNDVAAGNSGSPVLDASGRLVGLAFDANREALGGGLYYVGEFSRCVCLDIRYVLWVLDCYAGADNILAELGF